MARINKRSFRTGEKRYFVIFECFLRADTKQLDYYVIPTLVNEKPEIIKLHIGSNDTTKTSYDNVNGEDLAQRIVNIGKNVDLLVLTTS